MKMIQQAGVALILAVVLQLPVSAIADDRPEHHSESGFQNHPHTPEPPSLGPGFYLQRVLASFFLPEVPEDHVLPQQQAIDQFNSLTGTNSLTWIGQSTFLIRLDGKHILTDPFFSEYAGPFSMGPRRFVEPGIAADALPEIDVLIISHNHYDHLDEAFIEALPNKEDIRVFVPLKLKSFFTDLGYVHVHELDWYQSDSVFGFDITALPSVHYSGRGTADRNETLWCSWAIESTSASFYFVGDSAYSPAVFKQIGESFAPFDLALVTIGTYGNRKYGVNNPTTPEEAVQQGLDVAARGLVAMHWGTIEMSDEPLMEPAQRFTRAAKDAGFSSSQTWIMKIGETREFATTDLPLYKGVGDK
jgi:L-ascorbate metabolism protein UlaG (beta-lactamase superfamily)